MKRLLILFVLMLWATSAFAQSYPAVTNSGAAPANGCAQYASGLLTSTGTACSGGGTPGGTSGQIQYNNSGAFGGYTLGYGLTESAGLLLGEPTDIFPQSGATPTLTAATPQAALRDINNHPLSANVTSVTTPVAALMADGETLYYIAQQAASGGPYTIPTSGIAGSPFTAGAGVTMGSLVASCPTVPTTASKFVIYKLQWFAAPAVLDIVGCATDTLPYAPPVSGTVSASALTMTSNATLTAIPNLTASLVSGHSYQVYIQWQGNVGAGGSRWDLAGGTATASTVNGMDNNQGNGGGSYVQSRTSLSTVLVNSGGTSPTLTQLNEVIVCNGSGTLIPRFAQDNSNAASSIVNVGAMMSVTELN